MYKIFHGREKLPIDEFFETPANLNLGGHRFKLRQQLSHLAGRRFAFPVCIVEPWIKLPPGVFDSASENNFKICLFSNLPRTFHTFGFDFLFLVFARMPVVVISRASAFF